MLTYNEGETMDENDNAGATAALSQVGTHDDLVPMPGFLWVGGYGGRGCLVALCGLWLGWLT